MLERKRSEQIARGKIQGKALRNLGIGVLYQNVHDAFFLKLKTVHMGKKMKNTTNYINKLEAVTWLRGESYSDTLWYWCDVAGVSAEKVIKRCREWFSGEHAEGYEFHTHKEFEDVMGFNIRCFERIIRGEDGNNRRRRKNARKLCENTCSKAA